MCNLELNEEDFLNALVLKIKKLRKERKISQLDLANILGHKSPNYIAKIELRKEGANYNLKHIFIIANALNIEPNELLPSKEEIHNILNLKIQNLIL